jgi:hypothetical protein
MRPGGASEVGETLPGRVVGAVGRACIRLDASDYHFVTVSLKKCCAPVQKMLSRPLIESLALRISTLGRICTLDLTGAHQPSHRRPAKAASRLMRRDVSVSTSLRWAADGKGKAALPRRQVLGGTRS